MIVAPYVVAPTAIVLRIKTQAIRHLVVQVRRSSDAPALRVTIRGHRGRTTLWSLRPSTTYRIRVRSCQQARTLSTTHTQRGRRGAQRRPRCHPWSRPLVVRTLHSHALPRIAAVAGEPPIGALPELGMNDLSAATNHPSYFWGDYHALRMTWVRIVVPWVSYQPTSDAPDYTTEPWRVADAFMSRALDEGARVLVSIGGVPGWARLHQPDEALGSGARPDAYAAWIRLWLARYPQTSAVDQHEANCCSLTEYVATKDLARMLDASYPILHAAGVESIAGSWTEGGISGARARQAIRELGAYYQGRQPAFNSLGFHFYPSGFARRYGFEVASPVPSDSYYMTEFGRLQRDIDDAFPGQQMRWSITETGWSTPGGYQGDALSPEQQASAAVWELDEASRYTPRLEKVLWFLDVDQASRAGTSNIYHSAFRNVDGSEKPIVGAWRDMVGARS